MASSVVQFLLTFLLFLIIHRRVTEVKLPWSKVIAVSAIGALSSIGVQYLIGRYPPPTDFITQWVRTGHF
jgi:uncharacterized BrkB/YihY/UPF0761 family membrane protein